MIFTKKKSQKYLCIVEQDTFTPIPSQYHNEIVDNYGFKDLEGDLPLYQCTTSHVCEISFVPKAPLRLSWLNNKITLIQKITEVTYYLDVDIFHLKAEPCVYMLTPSPKDDLIEFKHQILYRASGGKILYALGDGKEMNLLDIISERNKMHPIKRESFIVDEWTWKLKKIKNYDLPTDVAK